jgi:hypothetical protein
VKVADVDAQGDTAGAKVLQRTRQKAKVLIRKRFAPAGELEAAECDTADPAICQHHRPEQREYLGTCAVVADEKLLERPVRLNAASQDLTDVVDGQALFEPAKIEVDE